MKVKLDQNTIQMISIFHNLTGTNVVDCLNEEDCIYFVVAEGQYGLAVGKGGAKIKNAERVFKKSIKVFEHSQDLEKFLHNLIPEIESMEMRNKMIFVKVSSSDRARTIGKAGKNVKVINKLLSRLFDVEELKVK